MSVENAIRQSGTTFAAYRYHLGLLIWARLSLSSGRIMFGNSIGYVNGQAVYPSLESYVGWSDWKPWNKGHALPGKL